MCSNDPLQDVSLPVLQDAEAAAERLNHNHKILRSGRILKGRTHVNRLRFAGGPCAAAVPAAVDTAAAPRA